MAYNEGPTPTEGNAMNIFPLVILIACAFLAGLYYHRAVAWCKERYDQEAVEIWIETKIFKLPDN